MINNGELCSKCGELQMPKWNEYSTSEDARACQVCGYIEVKKKKSSMDPFNTFDEAEEWMDKHAEGPISVLIFVANGNKITKLTMDWI